MYARKKSYFGFGKNSCIKPTKGESKPEPVKPCLPGIFLFGVVVPCTKGKPKGDPELN
jgi:hypothetical protein